MAFIPKNYKTNGGDDWQVGGKLIVRKGGKIVIQTGASVEGITTASIVDNLASNDATKALSAKQGKALNTAVTAKYTAAAATPAVAGLVKMAAEPTGEDTEALLASLIAALQTAGIVDGGA